MDTEKFQQENITANAIAEYVSEAQRQSRERFDENVELLDQVINNLTDNKDKFILTMLKASFSEIYITMQIETITGLMTAILLLKHKRDSIDFSLIEQMQKDIVSIKKTYTPIIKVMKKAIANQKKWMRDNK